MTPIKEQITFDDLVKIDIRVCKILEVERIPKSKLYKLKINTGVDERIVLTSISTQYEPEDLLNKDFPFVLNLEPRKMFGLESHGMILLSEGEDKKMNLINCSETGSIIL